MFGEDKADLFRATVEYCVDRLQLAPPGEAITSLTTETFWTEVGRMHDQALLQARHQPWLFGAARAVERLTPESLQREPLAELARRLMAGIETLITRGQELGLIRTDLPAELLFAWFRALDGASDDWLLAHLEQLNPETIRRISRQTMTTIKQALMPPTPGAA
jgi:AcrR family transcriptional regulator